MGEININFDKNNRALFSNCRQRKSEIRRIKVIIIKAIISVNGLAHMWRTHKLITTNSYVPLNRTKCLYIPYVLCGLIMVSPDSQIRWKCCNKWSRDLNLVEHVWSESERAKRGKKKEKRGNQLFEVLKKKKKKKRRKKEEWQKMWIELITEGTIPRHVLIIMFLNTFCELRTNWNDVEVF